MNWGILGCGDLYDFVFQLNDAAFDLSNGPVIDQVSIASLIICWNQNQ